MGPFHRQVFSLLLSAGTSTNEGMETSADAHLQQFIAGVEIGSLLEDGCDCGGQHLVSGR